MSIFNLDKLNKVLGLSDEGIEKIRDFCYNISRLKIKLSEKEKTLCESLGINSNLTKIVKSHNVSEIRALPSVNEYGEMDFENSTDGICAFYVMKNMESTSEIHRIIYRNKQKYLKKGYNLFYFQGDKYGEYYMALVKEKTDIDILKWRKTDGINHDITNSDLIEKIEEWQQRYDFVLWGCGRDWLQIFFIHEAPVYNFQLGASNEKYYKKYKIWEKRTPKFNKEFAGEVAEFCPDLLTQVYGSRRKLMEGMRQINGVYLWWD